MEKIKEFIEKIDKYAQYVANFAIFTTIILATAYFIFPDLRRFVEINLTNKKAWYAVGRVKPAQERWAIDTNNNKITHRNYYYAGWSSWHNKKRRKIVQATINSALNKVVVHSIDHHVMGRGPEKGVQKDNKKSNNDVISLSLKNECFIPHKFSFTDINGTVVHDNTTADTVHVWMYATKVTCN